MAQGFYAALTKILKANGFQYWKPCAGSHEKWINDNGLVLVFASKIMSRHTANGVLKDAGIKQKL